MPVSCIHLIGVFILLHNVLADEHEYRLTRYLMSNYDLAVRPSHNASVPLRLTFDLSLYQIINVDEKNQILTTASWITQKWTDYHLRWNVSDFNGITVIRVPASQVWRPDILLHNNVGVEQTLDILNTNVIVKHTGEVKWLWRALFKSSCSIDIECFPFDIQYCPMRFLSGAYDGLQVELIKEKEQMELSGYQVDGEFDLIGLSVTTGFLQLSCCEETYPEITYTLQLRRRPLFHVYNLILPCLLVNCVSLLTFCMPCESGEKVTLSMCSLLTMVIFFVFVKDTLPPSQKIPLIRIYYVASICLTISTTVFSVVTLNVYHRGNIGREVSPCLRSLVLGHFSKIFHSKCSSEQSPKEQKVADRQTSREEKLDFPHIEQYNFSPRLRKRMEMGEASDYSADEYIRQVFQIVGKIYEAVERNEIRIHEQSRKQNIKTEWQQISLVCDRLWLVLFLVAVTVVTLFVLLLSPYAP
ncbi:neuronal acetylcholine receptor subunit alpha-10-like [Tachypleus tridentatus]|uniref:neuronal acetylcholine receptor subunit alpha-10-like n=1 Tax=Tachypleus tridentatus TaxID=6853 RepID=UPI003FD4F356